MFTPGSEPHGAAVPARLSSPMDALGYVGHGKGPWDATTYDFRENFVLPPLAPPPLAVFFAAPMSATSRSIPATSISAIPTPPTSRKPDSPFIIDSRSLAAIHQNICRSCLPPIPGPFIVLCSMPPNHPGITGPIGHHSRAFSGRHATVGVVFPAIELFNDSGYPGPEPSILPCCHGVRALRGPLFLWLGFKVLFRCGKRSFLVFVVLSIANGPNQRLHWRISF